MRASRLHRPGGPDAFVFEDTSREQIQQYFSMVERGQLEIPRGPTWGFEQLPAAHRAMDEDRANGKMVVVLR